MGFNWQGMLAGAGEGLASVGKRMGEEVSANELAEAQDIRNRSLAEFQAGLAEKASEKSFLRQAGQEEKMFGKETTRQQEATKVNQEFQKSTAATQQGFEMSKLEKGFEFDKQVAAIQHSNKINEIGAEVQSKINAIPQIAKAELNSRIDNQLAMLENAWDTTAKNNGIDPADDKKHQEYLQMGIGDWSAKLANPGASVDKEDVAKAIAVSNKSIDVTKSDDLQQYSDWLKVNNLTEEEHRSKAANTMIAQLSASVAATGKGSFMKSQDGEKIDPRIQAGIDRYINDKDNTLFLQDMSRATTEEAKDLIRSAKVQAGGSTTIPGLSEGKGIAYGIGSMVKSGATGAGELVRATAEELKTQKRLRGVGTSFMEGLKGK